MDQLHSLCRGGSHAIGNLFNPENKSTYSNLFNGISFCISALTLSKYYRGLSSASQLALKGLKYAQPMAMVGKSICSYKKEDTPKISTQLFLASSVLWLTGTWAPVVSTISKSNKFLGCLKEFGELLFVSASVANEIENKATASDSNSERFFRALTFMYSVWFIGHKIEECDSILPKSITEAASKIPWLNKTIENKSLPQWMGNHKTVQKANQCFNRCITNARLLTLNFVGHLSTTAIGLKNTFWPKSTEENKNSWGTWIAQKIANLTSLHTPRSV